MIRILIADDHAIIRHGFREIVADQADMVVVGEAASAGEVLHLARRLAWDVLVLDINMPDRSGLEVVEDLKPLQPPRPVLVFTVFPEDQFALRLLKAGAAGYLTKDSAPEDLVKAIRKVCAGRKYISPSLAENLAGALDPEGSRPLHQALSDREFQVLRQLSSGKTAAQIADQLLVSVKTISTYRARLLQKMHMRTTAELMRYAICNGLVD
jgi:two-component system, NarL family, invasion response regulator UvrY